MNLCKALFLYFLALVLVCVENLARAESAAVQNELSSLSSALDLVKQELNAQTQAASVSAPAISNSSDPSIPAERVLEGQVHLEPFVANEPVLNCSTVQDLVKRHREEISAIENELRELFKALASLGEVAEREQAMASAEALSLKALHLRERLETEMAKFQELKLNEIDRVIVFKWQIDIPKAAGSMSSLQLRSAQLPGYFWNGQGDITEIDGVLAAPERLANRVSFHMIASPMRYCLVSWRVRLSVLAKVLVPLAPSTIQGCAPGQALEGGYRCEGRGPVLGSDLEVERHFELWAQTTLD